MKNNFLKTATIEDFKAGKIIYTSEGYRFKLVSKDSDGIWTGRGMDGQGEKAIYECEVNFYRVAD